MVALLAAGCTAGAGGSTGPSASAIVPPSPSPSASPSPLPASSPGPSGPTSSSAPGSPVAGPAPEPVVLSASATTTAAISASLPFAATGGGAATCRSVPDSTAIGVVTALALGELGTDTLRAIWAVPATATGLTPPELFIDGGDLPEGTFQPFWTGTAQVTGLVANGGSGTLIFSKLELDPDPAAKPGSAGPGGADQWPATLAGTLSWSCGPWEVPAASPTIPAPSVAP